jgi:small subunit ribosomal protein S20
MQPMAITRSAKKAHRSALRKRAFNAARKDGVAQALKALKKLVAEGKSKEARAAYTLVQQALDKAVKTHALDKNTASRRKSRLAKMVKKLG